jgi:hypothetical protein
MGEVEQDGLLRARHPVGRFAFRPVSRALAPVTHEVPSDIAANVFTNVGTVEIGEYREPNYPRVMVRRCLS